MDDSIDKFPPAVTNSQDPVFDEIICDDSGLPEIFDFDQQNDASDFEMLDPLHGDCTVPSTIHYHNTEIVAESITKTAATDVAKVKENKKQKKPGKKHCTSESNAKPIMSSTSQSQSFSHGEASGEALFETVSANDAPLDAPASATYAAVPAIATQNQYTHVSHTHIIIFDSK